MKFSTSSFVFLLHLTFEQVASRYKDAIFVFPRYPEIENDRKKEKEKGFRVRKRRGGRKGQKGGKGGSDVGNKEARIESVPFDGGGRIYASTYTPTLYPCRVGMRMAATQG